MFILSCSKIEFRARIGKKLWEKFALSMIYELLQEDKLDRNRLFDAKYVKSVISENLEYLINEERDVIIERRGLFVPHARDIFAAGGLEAAIVLLVTAIEHRLNFFYRRVLSPKLEDEMVTQVIRSNMHTKTGWLLSLVSNHVLPDELKAKINRLAEVRNAIVHYKFKPKSFESVDWHHPLPQVTEIDIEEAIRVVDELEDALEKIHEEMYPDYKLSKEVAANVLES